jgi:hypothetical protein
MKMKMNIELGKLEFRRVEPLGEFRKAKEKGETFEIVKWNDENCYTLCHFKLFCDGYSASFIGARPFDLEEDEKRDFYKLMELAQRILDAKFISEERLKSER